MGFFDKLFDKKTCAICGSDIGLLGNRKLADGNMCKACEEQLSPWFSGRKESTVEQIKQQLAYREENRKALSNFEATRVFGDTDIRLCLDEDAGKFLVTWGGRLQEENPDLVDVTRITDCFLDVEEDESEQEREQPDGTSVPYSPPRYLYTYDFHVVIRVDHPYFDEIRFDLNDETVELNPDRPVTVTLKPTPQKNPQYIKYETMGRELVDALIAARDQRRTMNKAAAEPRKACSCPNCGATTVPDANQRCEYCGSILK